MNVINRRLIAAVFTLTSACSSATFAFEHAREQNNGASNGKFSGELRLGYISAKNENSTSVQGSAIGGALTYNSAHWHGISANGTLYATQQLFNNDNHAFFASDGDSYAILGQAYLQANVAATDIKVGRFGFDSPHADRDDIRMVPNTFSGILLTNTAFTDTTVYLAHLDKWAGVDSDKPEDFTDLNSRDGLNVLGVVYQGFDNVALQSWYYNANNLASFLYVDAIFEMNDFSFGAQYAKQADSVDGFNAADGNVYGLKASYSVNNFTFSSAYNQVSGTVVNGFGGDPFFTSAADHTIADVTDQKAFALGIEYTGIDNLTLKLLNVAFDQGEDEIDVFISYDLGNDMLIDFIYHHLHDDGDIVFARLNVGF